MGRGIAYARADDAARADKDFAAIRAMATEPAVLNNICWSKATAGLALASALVDCDAALAKEPGEATFLDSRGFVLLRLGRFDEAITSYDRALAIAPRLAMSLFGRAIARSRRGDRTGAEADSVAALAIDVNLRATYEEYGLTL